MPPLHLVVAGLSLIITGMLVNTSQSFQSFHNTQTHLTNFQTSILASSTVTANISNQLLSNLQSSFETSILNFNSGSSDDEEEKNKRLQYTQEFIDNLDTENINNRIVQTLNQGLNFSELQEAGERRYEDYEIKLINTDVLPSKLKSSDKKYASALTTSNEVDQTIDPNNLNSEFITSDNKLRISENLLKKLLDNSSTNIIKNNQDFFGVEISDSDISMSLDNLPNGIELKLNLVDDISSLDVSFDPFGQNNQDNEEDEEQKSITQYGTAQLRIEDSQENLIPPEPVPFCEANPSDPSCLDPFVCPGGSGTIFPQDSCYSTPFANGCACFCEANPTACPQCAPCPAPSTPASPAPQPPAQETTIVLNGERISLNVPPASKYHVFGSNAPITESNPLLISSEYGFASAFNQTASGDIRVRQGHILDWPRNGNRPREIRNNANSSANTQNVQIAQLGSRTFSFRTSSVNIDSSEINLTMIPRYRKRIGFTTQGFTLRQGRGSSNIFIPAGSIAIPRIKESKRLNFNVHDNPQFSDFDEIQFFDRDGNRIAHVPASRVPRAFRNSIDLNRFRRPGTIDAARDARQFTDYTTQELFPHIATARERVLAWTRLQHALAEETNDSISARELSTWERRIRDEFNDNQITQSEQTLVINKVAELQAVFEAGITRYNTQSQYNAFLNQNGVEDYKDYIADLIEEQAATRTLTANDTEIIVRNGLLDIARAIQGSNTGDFVDVVGEIVRELEASRLRASNTQSLGPVFTRIENLKAVKFAELENARGRVFELDDRIEEARSNGITLGIASLQNQRREAITARRTAKQAYDTVYADMVHYLRHHAIRNGTPYESIYLDEDDEDEDQDNDKPRGDKSNGPNAFGGPQNPVGFGSFVPVTGNGSKGKPKPNVPSTPAPPPANNGPVVAPAPAGGKLIFVNSGYYTNIPSSSPSPTTTRRRSSGRRK